MRVEVDFAYWGPRGANRDDDRLVGSVLQLPLYIDGSLCFKLFFSKIFLPMRAKGSIMTYEMF